MHAARDQALALVVHAHAFQFQFKYWGLTYAFNVLSGDAQKSAITSMSVKHSDKSSPCQTGVARSAGK